jgi:hypothetical protein
MDEVIDRNGDHDYPIQNDKNYEEEQGLDQGRPEFDLNGHDFRDVWEKL